MRHIRVAFYIDDTFFCESGYVRMIVLLTVLAMALDLFLSEPIIVGEFSSADCATLRAGEYQNLSDHEKRNWARYYVKGSTGVYSSEAESAPDGCTPHIIQDTPVLVVENAIIEE